jgi:membrane fusion protein (multidrug efflux system)
MQPNSRWYSGSGISKAKVKMIVEAEIETPSQAAAAGQLESTMTGATLPPRRVNLFVIGIVALVLVAIGAGWYLYSRGYEGTDDAQVDGHLNPIAARIDGTIKAVQVDDNQTIQAGMLLVELDPNDDKAALQQAQAQYDQAVAQLSASHPNLPITRINNLNDLTSQRAEVVGSEASLAVAQLDLDSAVAKLKESQAINERDQADFGRYKTLYDDQVASRADLDHYKATAAAQTQTVAANQAAFASAQKTVEQRMAQLAQQHSKLQQTQSSAPLQVAIREADIKSQQANVEAAQAALEQSRLNLGYCRIAAPVSGVVTQRSAEIGARISKGQQLFMIVQTDDLWVTANFKETQLARIHPGQHVRIHVDALHGDFDGTVDSMPAVTGSRTSVLPPENATGNYVKVIQRLPVRIRFNQGQRNLDKLRPGMSVEPTVGLD